MNASNCPQDTVDQHTVERNKKVSLRWHQAWGTLDIESAYRECLAEDFVADLFGQGRVDREEFIRRDRMFEASLAVDLTGLIRQRMRGRAIV
jgi:hypothetical protein